MTWIRVEPMELSATAGALQRAADELSGISAGARQDCSTCLPTQAEALAGAALGLVDQLLTLLALDLVLQAVDLLNRGAVATADSLTVAAASSASTVSLVGGSSFSDAVHVPTPSFGGSLVGGSSFSDAIHAPTPSSGGPLVGGYSLTDGIHVSTRPLPGALVGGPFAWKGPAPSELWSPSLGGAGVPGPIGSPFIEPKPWASRDDDLDGILNGQDRNPQLDDRTDTDRGGTPDAFDPSDNDPRR